LSSSPGDPDFVDKGAAEWNIKRHTFKYGLYLVEFRVILNNAEGLFNSDLRFFSITESPIIAGITGGSHVRRGFNQEVQLDGSPSEDPDVQHGDYSDMTFTWLCKRKGESFPSIPPDIPIVSSVDPTGKGGCFDTGIGRLSSSNRIATINTGEMLVNNSYTIKLIVSKVGRNDSFEQILDVVKGDPPQISIRYYKASMDYTFYTSLRHLER
jgi:hypothetical protein